MYSVIERETIQDKICKRLEQGESLKNITSLKEFPNKDTIYEWLKKDTQFADNYTRARVEQSNTYANEIIEIADGIGDDATREQISKANLQIESRKWIAAKLLPKKYGSAQNQTNIQIVTESVTGMQIIDSIEEDPTE